MIPSSTRRVCNLSAEEQSEIDRAEIKSRFGSPEDLAAMEERIARQKPVPPFWKSKYENECSSFWDRFYKRHQANFFKDRHYLHTEWPELLAPGAVFLEIGCGVGNTVFPLLEQNPSATIYACDFSETAVGIVKANPAYASGRITAFACDITKDDPLLAVVPAGSLDIITAIFCLSALKPDTIAPAIARLATLLKPGAGKVLFRDYCRYDEAQLRFTEKMGDNYHARGDGTLAYYFDKDEICALFEGNGFRAERVEVFSKEIINRKESLAMHRLWIQATFVRL